MWRFWNCKRVYFMFITDHPTGEIITSSVSQYNMQSICFKFCSKVYSCIKSQLWVCKYRPSPLRFCSTPCDSIHPANFNKRNPTWLMGVICSFCRDHEITRRSHWLQHQLGMCKTADDGEAVTWSCNFIISTEAANYGQQSRDILSLH
jgi:hypothetical protein